MLKKEKSLLKIKYSKKLLFDVILTVNSVKHLKIHEFSPIIL